MLDLAISTDQTPNGNTVVLTNYDRKLSAPGWPQDCEFQLVASSPSGKTCKVVDAHLLSRDIDQALQLLVQAGLLKGRKPDWYRRLVRCSLTARPQVGSAAS